MDQIIIVDVNYKSMLAKGGGDMHFSPDLNREKDVIGVTNFFLDLSKLINAVLLVRFIINERGIVADFVLMREQGFTMHIILVNGVVMLVVVIFGDSVVTNLVDVLPILSKVKEKTKI